MKKKKTQVFGTIDCWAIDVRNCIADIKRGLRNGENEPFVELFRTQEELREKYRGCKMEHIKRDEKYIEIIVKLKPAKDRR